MIEKGIKLDSLDVLNKKEKKDYDVIIIGGGPAGLTAGIYSARSGLKTLLIEKIAVGGQIFLSDLIENYPGVETASGPDLIAIMENQAKKFGVDFVFEEVVDIKVKDKKFSVQTSSENEYSGFAVIIATGARYKELGVPGEAKFKGRGISNCATCDGAFYKNMDVAVVGGGDTAIQEAIYLTKFAKTVYVIHRRDKLRATKILQDNAFKNPKIKFIFDSVVEEILGNKNVEGVKIKNLKTNEIKTIQVSGVFVFIGLIPNTDFLKKIIELDEQGYIKTDTEMKTSKSGIWACGDCVQKKLRQVVTAAGDGALAAFDAMHYIEEIKVLG